MSSAIEGSGTRFAALVRDAERGGLACRGGFHPGPEEAVPTFPDGTRPATLVLLGFVGDRQWDEYQRAPEAQDRWPDPLDRWSRRVIDALGERHRGVGVYPNEGPPWWPFQQWAMRAERLHASPLGLLIHPEYGLWHAYRGALAFRDHLELPPVEPRPSPCEACVEKPCLRGCPVGAFTGAGYDVAACARHVRAAAGVDCLERGCEARRRCPVGAAYAYRPDHAAFHVRAFIARR